MLDLDKLKQKLDLALSTETEESFKEWQNKSGNVTRTGQSLENGVVDIIKLPTKREFYRTEENRGLWK